MKPSKRNLEAIARLAQKLANPLKVSKYAAKHRLYNTPPGTGKAHIVGNGQ